MSEAKKNDAPSAEAMEAASRSLAMLQTVSDPDFAYLARRVAVEMDRVRREARAEAFEEGATACHYVSGELREINPDRTQVGTASDICAMRLHELAAKERAK